MSVKQSKALNAVKKVGFKSGRRQKGLRDSATARDSMITTYPAPNPAILDQDYS